MNFLVCVTEVLHPHDLELPEGGGRPRGLRMPNRADECAVEMAVRLPGALWAWHGGRVTLLSVAPPEAEEALDVYLGLGADALLRVWEDALEAADAAGVALVLARAAERLGAELILCGDRAFGGEGSGLTGPAVAERLGWPFAGGIVAIETRDPGELRAFRLIERGDRQLLGVPLPAVIAVSPEADAPRYPALARIRRAARETLDLAALDLGEEAVCGTAAPVEVSGWSFARLRPRKLFVPPSTASAIERLGLVMGGGRPARPAPDAVVEGPPDRAAEQILQFLRQERLL